MGKPQILHKCDTPLCVNPGHLFAGTNDDNVADKMAKGRQARGADTRPDTRARGERQWKARLRPAQVLAIRSSEKTNAALAIEYGVGTSTIVNVRLRYTWKHVA
jgi:hypothetical protein